MFKDAKILDAEGTLDVELIESYITDHLGGVIGEEYASVKKNITFTDGYSEGSPSTGDSANNAVWILFFLSLAALSVCSRKK